jgi:outer membrane biosynthesis protein TonB
MELRSNLLTPSAQKRLLELEHEETQLGQRARALLALQAGATLNEAAEKSGLTRGQVRYILERYRNYGIKAFSGIGKSVEPKTDVKVAEEKPGKDKKNEKKQSKKKKDAKKSDKKNKKKSNKKSEKKKVTRRKRKNSRLTDRFSLLPVQ